MPIDVDRLVYQPLSVDDVFDDFTSSDNDLADFLRLMSKTYHSLSIGFTHVVRHEGQVVGYFTLASADIRVKTMGQRERIPGAERVEHYPAVLIGRLAVDHRFANQGIGKRILQVVYGLVTEVRQRVAVRFLLVNTTQGSQSWWQERGFTFLGDPSGRRQPFMYLDIERMEH